MILLYQTSKTSWASKQDILAKYNVTDQALFQFTCCSMLAASSEVHAAVSIPCGITMPYKHLQVPPFYSSCYTNPQLQ